MDQAVALDVRIAGCLQLEVEDLLLAVNGHVDAAFIICHDLVREVGCRGCRDYPGAAEPFLLLRRSVPHGSDCTEDTQPRVFETPIAAHD